MWQKDDLGDLELTTLGIEPRPLSRLECFMCSMQGLTLESSALDRSAKLPLVNIH